MTTESTQPNLAQLILTKKGDRTYAKLARDCGGAPTDRRLNGMVMRPISQFPDIETMRGLAIGLRVDVSEVVLAASRSLGLQIGGSNPGALIVHGAGHLPDSAQEALISMAAELMKLHRPSSTPRSFTEFQAQLRQDFAHNARLRRVPAAAIEDALKAPGWYFLTPEDDQQSAVEVVLGWAKTDNSRQLKAAMREVFTQPALISQDDVELAADKGEDNIHPEELEHSS